MTSPDLSDQWELRHLVERYANAADRADGTAAAQLFTEDAELVVWLDPANAEPTSQRRGREEIAAAISWISKYPHTHHSIGNSAATILADRATGETRCEAHHLIGEAPDLRDQTLYIRYLDEFARVDGRWLISRRELHVNWVSITPVESA
jgi:ketosteroid isomerase-like protein